MVEWLKRRESIRQKLDKESAASLEHLSDDEEEDLFCYTTGNFFNFLLFFYVGTLINFWLTKKCEICRQSYAQI